MTPTERAMIKAEESHAKRNVKTIMDKEAAEKERERLKSNR